MFTGLVEAIGVVAEVERSSLGARFLIECPWTDLEIGESIAVDGVCLSVTERVCGRFRCDASAETLQRTTVGTFVAGSRTHLERALCIGERLGGHLVTGHVDGVGRIVSISPLGDARRVTFEVPPPLAPFVAPKASVAVDGVSLTVNGATGTRFDVVLVPITLRKTLFATKAVGAAVNIEVDVLAKYVARLLGRAGVDGLGPGDLGEGVTLDLLASSGYLSAPASPPPRHG
jgi:riboflavin synthase